MKEIENKLAFMSAHEVFRLPTAETIAEAYKNANPFSHVVLDDFISEDVVRPISAQIHTERATLPVHFDDDVQKNKTISTGSAVPRLLRLLAAKLGSAEFLRYLESVTGLKGLVPDPYYNTEYGYYHVVGPGGVLGSHVDHSHHQSLKIPHVLNLVVYLTENWDENEGGALCLFNSNGREVIKKIPSKFNRAAIFAASPIAFHGVEPIDRSSTRKRHSIYFAYYSVMNLQELIEGLPAAYGADALENGKINYGTYFVLPWTSLFKKKNAIHLRARIWAMVNLLVPPLISLGALAVYKRFRSRRS
jgi:Rps23 Pro-64 3,4-dihydroxylase Tpa1-like proline 4-hydroxylase